MDLHDNLQRTLYYTGQYERDFVRYLSNEARPHEVFVDVGANIGVHSLVLAKKLAAQHGTVVSFEPAPDVASAIEATAKAAGLENLIVHRVGLGCDEATRGLRRRTDYDQGDKGIRSLFGDGPVEYEVRILPFDTWIAEHPMPRMDIVKMDIEGAEFDALLGMQESVRRLTPRIVAVEIRDDLLKLSGVSADSIHNLMSDLGYFEHRRFGPNVVFSRTL